MNPLELRGIDRIFQIDRDTILIYTGLHLDDVRPFARIGAGNELPASIVRLIENVLLPEKNLWNIGFEEIWLRHAIEMGISKITYVGSKEILTHLHRYFNLEELYTNGKKEAKIHLPVEYKFYQQLSQKELMRDKSSIVYMHTGEFQVLVGGSRVLDSGNYFRSRITIDKEYSLLKKILEKIPVERAKESFSFFLFPHDVVSALFNFHGSLLAINPPDELHYRLFELHIDPDRIVMAITSSPYLPGFVEIFRRADVLQKEIAVCYPDIEKLSLLKRIYYYSRPKFFSDGGTLPFARYVNYYESKTKSHFAMAFRVRDDVEVQMKFLFPLANVDKISKSFDYIKSPFDVEFLQIHHKKDLETDGASNFYFLYQGAIPDKTWKNIRLRDNVFPALYNIEFKLHQIVELNEIIDFFKEVFANTVFEEYIVNLANKVYTLESSENLYSLQDELYLIRTQAIPTDKILLYNLAEALKIIYHFAVTYSELPRKVNRLFLDVKKRFSHSRIRIEDLQMVKMNLQGDIFVKTGELVALFLKEISPLWNIIIQYPPDPGSAIELEKEYRRYLKEQHRLIDKGMGTPYERQLLEFLEKLLEERIYFNEQRKRLEELLDVIRPNLEVVAESLQQKTKKLPFHFKLPYRLRILVETLKIPELVNFLSGMAKRKRSSSKNRS